MKKLLIFIVLAFIPIQAQSTKDIGNCTTTTLDSAEVFTGYRRDVTAYNSVAVSMWSDDTASVQIQFGELVNTVFTVQRYFNYTYLANDSTFTKTVPVVAPFYRVVVTNAVDDSMTVFKLTSMLHKGYSPPIDVEAYVTVNVSNGSGTSAVNIQDGGNSITVDGTVSTTAQTVIDSLYGVVTLTADSTAYQFSALIADTLDVYSVTFTPYTSGAIVHFGTNNSLTIDNGAQPSYYTWDCTRYGDSTTDFWLASTANTTKVRYTIKVRR